MTKRKPLPYAAVYQVDLAMAENADAARSLLPLISTTPVSSEERYRLIGVALHHIHQSSSFLKDARDVNHESSEKE